VAAEPSGEAAETEKPEAGKTETDAPAGEKPAEPTSESSSSSGDEQKLAELEAKLEKNPGDAAVKKELVDAHFRVGHAMMYDDDLPPRVKYPGALKHFRRTLELEPGHAKAAAEKKQIEDIYRSMGRPIPE
jgi:hypothetical protein